MLPPLCQIPRCSGLSGHYAAKLSQAERLCPCLLPGKEEGGERGEQPLNSHLFPLLLLGHSRETKKSHNIPRRRQWQPAILFPRKKLEEVPIILPLCLPHTVYGQPILVCTLSSKAPDLYCRNVNLFTHM